MGRKIQESWNLAETAVFGRGKKRAYLGTMALKSDLERRLMSHKGAGGGGVQGFLVVATKLGPMLKMERGNVWHQSQIQKTQIADSHGVNSVPVLKKKKGTTVKLKLVHVWKHAFEGRGETLQGLPTASPLCTCGSDNLFNGRVLRVLGAQNTRSKSPKIEKKKKRGRGGFRTKWVFRILDSFLHPRHLCSFLLIHPLKSDLEPAQGRERSGWPPLVWLSAVL